MQPPIPLGTVLQNRYRLTKILGQGGFGRTYLAEDQGRFNELCALKELIPAQNENYLLEKSKELFQREAAILYQIQHPQVPQFRATFEQDQRLFIVQDYVEGQTYRQLLDERKDAMSSFSEAEVLHLLRQLLPVLAKLHSRGIIHRDITPDNIILRQRDNKPVLIDFGVVKELATRLQSATYQATTVGKLGYAPSEQMQTGRAYPSSDLYALAVSCVVLLTGREPQELFDDTHLSWNWERFATVSSGLASVLNRMLSFKPGDRYQSVASVVAALQALDNNPTHHPGVKTLGRFNNQTAAPDLSQIKTIAVGRRPDLVAANTNHPNQPTPVIPAPKNRAVWDNPWAIAFMGICVALLAGIGSWALVSYILSNRKPTPPKRLPFPSPLVSESPTPSPTLFPTPTPSNEPVNYTQRLNVAAGEDTIVEGSIKANTTINYTFSGTQGQKLSTDLTEGNVLLTVLGPNQETIDDRARRVMLYQGTLPTTGDYTIVLSPVQGVAAESNYKLRLRLENPVEPLPTPTSTPIPTPTPTASTVVPTVQEQSISFPPGQTSTQVSGQTNPTEIKRYLVNVQEGQQLAVEVEQGIVTLDIRYPNGQLVENADKYLTWQGEVRKSGAYQIDVIAEQDQNINFTLKVSVK